LKTAAIELRAKLKGVYKHEEEEENEEIDEEEFNSEEWMDEED